MIRWSILLALLLIALISGSIYWMRSDRFVISTISVTGANFADPQKIQTEAQHDLSGNYLFVYPKANELVYPAHEIQADILKDFPQVQSLSLAVTGGPALSITVKERTPFVLWCGQMITLSAGTSTPDLSQCYFADSNGYIFNEAPHFSGNAYPIFYGGLGTLAMASTSTSPDDSSDVIQNSILDPATLMHLLAFGQAVSSFGFNVHQYQVTEDPSGNICDLYYGTSTSSYLRVDCADDFSPITANLQSFVDDPRFATSTPATYKYIDLRFGDKIVYKRK